MKYKVLEFKDIETYDNLSFLVGEKDTGYLKSFLDEEYSFGFVAIEDNQFVGFLYGYILKKPFDKDMFYVHSLDVDHRYRRRGIGTSLMKMAIKYGEEMDCYKGFVITNRSNEFACKVYEKVGGVSFYNDDVVYEYKKRD